MIDPTSLPRVGSEGSPFRRSRGGLDRLLQVATIPLALSLAVLAATGIHQQWLPPTALIFAAMVAATTLARLAERLGRKPMR